MSSIDITSGNFQSEVLESQIPVLIDFWAPWCGPCKMIGPLVDELADDYSGRIKVGKVNVDDEGRLAEQHGITSVPALFLYNNGAVAGQRIGAALKHEIEALFKNLI